MIIFFVAMPLNLNAQARGYAALDCGQFIKTDRDNNMSTDVMYMTAILAYLSALEWSTKDNRLGINHTAKVSNESLYYSVLQECRNKPLMSVGEAILRTYYERLERSN